MAAGTTDSLATPDRLDRAFANQPATPRRLVSIAGAGQVSAGQALHYQFWFRDPGDEPFPCGPGLGKKFNLKNGRDLRASVRRIP